MGVLPPISSGARDGRRSGSGCRRSGSDRRSYCRHGSPPELSALLSLFSSLVAVARGSCSQLHKMQTRVVIFAGSRARAGQDPPPQRRADTTRSRSRSAPRGQDLRSLSGTVSPVSPLSQCPPGWGTSCFTSSLVFGLFPCFLPCRVTPFMFGGQCRGTPLGGLL